MNDPAAIGRSKAESAYDIDDASNKRRLANGHRSSQSIAPAYLFRNIFGASECTKVAPYVDVWSLEIFSSSMAKFITPIAKLTAEVEGRAVAELLFPTTRLLALACNVHTLLRTRRIWGSSLSQTSLLAQRETID